MEVLSGRTRLLIVHADRAVAETIQSCFPSSRYVCATATKAIAALEILKNSTFDLTICAIRLPVVAGLELLRRTLARNSQAAFLMLSDAGDSALAGEAMKLGAYDCLHIPFECPVLVAKVESILNQQRLRAGEEILRALNEKPLHKRAEHLHNALYQVGKLQQSTLDMLVAALDARERQPNLHSLRAQAFSLLLAEQCGYCSLQMRDLSYGALLHDIGKIAIPDAILLKPGPLTPEEFQVICYHATFGSQLLSRIPDLQSAATLARSHHERVDGKGYPSHLKGDAIPLEARIFAVADTFDVITAGRIYRAPRSIAEARAEIKRCRGTQFDRDVVDVFLTIPDDQWLAAREDVAKRYQNLTERFSGSTAFNTIPF